MLARAAAGLGVATVAGAVAVLAGCGEGVHTAAAGRSGELRLTLTVTPASARLGATVRVSVTAADQHARGALGYVLRYGDGATTASGAVPQFCLAGAGRPVRQTWEPTHRYRAKGSYGMSATVSVNCTGERATAVTRVVVR